jgi:hypothetical protein
MGDELATVLWLGMALLLVWSAAPATVVAARGYDAGRWFLACGLDGVIALACFLRLPRAGLG